MRSVPPRPMHHVIHIETDAPVKPAEGDACNGCGVCCLAEPCPVGVLVSGRRRGACAALVWSAADRRYHCGMLTEPKRHLGAFGPWLRGPMRRWIAAGTGCDSNLEVTAGQASDKRDRA